MSTRGTIIVKSRNKKVYLYRHCDAYDLHNTVEAACSGKSFNIWESVESMVDTIIDYDDDIRENDFVTWDSEYICVVDINKHNVKMYDVDWNIDPQAHTHEEYLDKYSIISDVTYNAANKPINHSFSVNLKNSLKKGIVAFKYIKTNGEVRKAFGTLNSEYSEDLANYVANGLRKVSEDVVTYWDLEKKGWRTVKNENILEIF